jgi:hypothetical protein
MFFDGRTLEIYGNGTGLGAHVEANPTTTATPGNEYGRSESLGIQGF